VVELLEEQKVLSIKELYLDGTKTGWKADRRRKIDVEPVFGKFKQYMGFTRFTLRGRKGVLTELGLVAFTHNFSKVILSKMFDNTLVYA